ncbi:MAG: hypothetical protein ACYDDA_03745 [Acidiferrobacteraceae bacterium]
MMDGLSIDFLFKLIHTGGQGALIVLVWIGAKMASAATAAHNTLKNIEKRMIEDRATLGASNEIIRTRLDSIHSDLQALPLQVARNRRIND